MPDYNDIAMLVSLFETFLQGISTQARDDVPYEAIDAAITQLMSVWDLLSAKMGMGARFERGQVRGLSMGRTF